MKSNIFNATRAYVHKHLGHIVTFMSSVFLVLALALGFTQFASAQTYTTLTGTMDVGARGSNVTNLQSYLASNPSLYPEGLVTGYYGSLTRAAVQRFQAFYGIVSSGSPSTTGYGRVGPMTLAKLNSLMMGGTTSTDMSGPSFYNAIQSKTNTTATFNFNTNESATARVVYNTSPLMFNEGDMNSNGFGPIGGASVTSANGMSTSHSITVPNLQPNTTYYYTVIATDAAGNVSVWGPNNALRTNQ
jgi:peptidoglycan hydrolase-like protein with peptidoglycan-binding domain